MLDAKFGDDPLEIEKNDCKPENAQFQNLMKCIFDRFFEAVYLAPISRILSITS